jgi:predicted AAA+ superfamily ATPase
MVRREAEAHLRAISKRYPVVVVLGPRQSGKTTLCRRVFARKPYASLEDPDTRQFALTDPRGFLAQFPNGAVLDEVQRAPELTSYLQAIVDAKPTSGSFVLTGSENLTITQGVSQSLAGRAALMTLLPLGLHELSEFRNAPQDLFDVLYSGSYPAIFDREIPAHEWLANYVRTYVERDVRQLLRVNDLLAFQTFLGLCAGHSGQILNLSSLGAGAGINHNTAKAWLSVLEASYLLRRVPPWFANTNKRLVKSPKLHFLDSGLLCYLLGIRSGAELKVHASRGAIFESWVVSEVYKARLNRGLDVRASFFRDHIGNEVDLLIEAEHGLLAIEVKSGQTVATDFFRALEKLAGFVGRTDIQSILVYGGESSQARTKAQVVGWRDLERIDWTSGTLAKKRKRAAPTPKRRAAPRKPAARR